MPERAQAGRATSVLPGYNTPIPPQIMTPDRVESRIGTLEFADGVPTSETARLVFDHLDFSRAVKVFLDGIPAASLEAMRRAHDGMGADACHKVLIMDQLLDSDPLFLTGNTDTVYLSGILDLERDGPTVVEVPPDCGPGTVNDAWFVTDTTHTSTLIASGRRPSSAATIAGCVTMGSGAVTSTRGRCSSMWPR